MPLKVPKSVTIATGAVLGIFIWVGQSDAKQISGRPTGVAYVGIMGMTRAVWVGQARVWVGHGLPGLIARTASASRYFDGFPPHRSDTIYVLIEVQFGV